jgi:HK97 family phage prohead protease
MKTMKDNIEQRTFSVEHRNESERSVVGMAAIYESETNLGWFRERIEKGAFDEALAKSDVRALFNHDPNHLLARTSSGTLDLRLTDKGLEYSFDLPNTSSGNDLLELMKRGDITQSSFAFTVAEQSWEERQMENGEWEYTRVIKRVEELFDVSPVTYPAYKDTTVALRSFEARKKEIEKPKMKTKPVSLMRRRAESLNY